MNRHNFHFNLDARTLESLVETAGFLKAQGLVNALPELKTAGPLTLPRLD